MLFRQPQPIFTTQDVTVGTQTHEINQDVIQIYSDAEVPKTVTKEEILHVQLHQAKSYQEWHEIAMQIDIQPGKLQWRQTRASTLYDFKLITARIQGMKKAIEDHDVPALLCVLFSGQMRGLAGILDKRLYSVMYRSTKLNIEEYFQTTVKMLETLAEAPDDQYKNAKKVEIFNGVKNCFGNTALLLHGGATFGLFHLGVVKTLFENDILPRIITGSSIGALIAALVCVKKDDELPGIFEEKGVNLEAFANKSQTGAIARKVTRLICLIQVNQTRISARCKSTGRLCAR
jgi:TAG lipase / lysophosphatidylethanolamine acyltransferase